MKNVNPRLVLDLTTQMSALTEKKFKANDTGFFQRLEKFIEQEKLSDQRFGVHAKYTIEIPENYKIIDNETSYQEFLAKWNPEQRDGVKIPDPVNFIEQNFMGGNQLIPGKQYLVTEYGTRVPWMSTQECFSFLEKEQAGLCGLPGLLTLLDLYKDKVTFKSDGVVSLDYSVLPNRDGAYIAEYFSSGLALNYFKEEHLREGVILVTFKLK